MSWWTLILDVYVTRQILMELASCWVELSVTTAACTEPSKPLSILSCLLVRSVRKLNFVHIFVDMADLQPESDEPSQLL